MNADHQQERPEKRRVPLCRSVHCLALLGLSTVIGLVVVVRAFSPPLQSAREAHPSSHCKNTLKQISIALHNYHDIYGCFPPAYVADEDGTPMHSWRVLLLPYLDGTAIHRTYRFDEPWNGPNNSQLGETPFHQFHCRSQQGRLSSRTDYLVVVGPHTAFPGAKSTTRADITDEASQTIMVVEVANSDMHWMEPRDLDVREMAWRINPPAGKGISSAHEGGANVLFADDRPRFLPDDLPPNTVRAMLTIDGGEAIPAWDE